MFIRKSRRKYAGLGLSKEYSDMTPKAQPQKEKKMLINWTSSKLNFSSVKYTIKRIKRQYTDWKKALANHISEKELVYRMYTINCQNSKIRKQSNF